MRKLILTTTAIFTLGAGAALAALTAESVVSSLQAQGFENMEIKVGLTTIKAEASKGADKYEITYDIETGAIVKQEFYPGEGAEVDPGVEIKTGEDDDDHGKGSGHDDDEDDDDDDDEDDDDDHSGHGSDDGDDHDSGDDHGSDDD